MKRMLIIELVFIAVFAVLSVVIFLLIRMNSGTPSNTVAVSTTNSNGFGASTSTIPGGALMGGTTGSAQPGMKVITMYNTPLEVNDFLKDPETVKSTLNPGQYSLGHHFAEDATDPKADETPPYVITYFSATTYFNVTLYQEPLGKTRETAQRYLMDHLGISQNQMCLLKYMVSVPNRVSQIYAGKDLGFSFCPGATPLP
jgi:hypothetical protein